MRFLRDVSVPVAAITALVLAAGAAGQAQKQGSPSSGPRIEFTEIPPADCGGPDRTDLIAGKVIGAAPRQFRLTIYAAACNGVLYIQPTVAAPFTNINSDGSFDAYIHLGLTYYVLLVKAGFKPEPQSTAVPEEGGDIVLVAKVHGKKK